MVGYGWIFIIVLILVGVILGTLGGALGSGIRILIEIFTKKESIETS